MSAGTFVRSRYEGRDGTIYNCRTQPETLALSLNSVVNAAPAGAVTGQVSARMRGSRRSFGVTARKVSLEFTATLPDGYSGDNVELPILQASVFDGIVVGQTGTYLGAAVAVVSKTAEQVR